MRQWILLLVFIAGNEAKDINLPLDRYLSYEEMGDFLKSITTTYSNITTLYSIGKSYEGKELLVVRISGGEDQPQRPNLKLVGNIHGNEAVGREILLRFIKYLVDEYNSGNERVRRLLDYAHVHILPSLNPDGFATALNKSATELVDLDSPVLPHCLTRPGRKNSLGQDLNRNFPDFFSKDRPIPQNETAAVIRWLEEIPFILSASLHGGHVVANYPFDSKKYDAPAYNEPHLTDDNEEFKHLAQVYANAHPYMHKGQGCNKNYAKGQFPGGITNGAEWYPAKGSMQDYNYMAHGCMELTLEISCCKFPEPSQLPTYWNDNREALLQFLEESRRGVRGVVVDNDGAPVPNATLWILGRELVPFHSTTKGEFWKILLAGDYFLQVEANGFKNRTVALKVPEPKNPEWAWPKTVTVMMTRTGSSEETPTSSFASTGRSTTEDLRHFTGPSPVSSPGPKDIPGRTSQMQSLTYSRLLLILLILFFW